MKVAIIGAGPSGLVTLKYLTQAHSFLGCPPIEARLFELQPRIGGAFASRVYEDAELVSSKQLTTFSDFRSSHPGDFLSPDEYVRYLHDYATHFGLWGCIHLNTRVVGLRRRNKGHVVVYQTESKDQETWGCDAVAICSGLHVEPNIPLIPGIQHVASVFHSSEFKSRAQFGRDASVLVVGTGETGADVAFLAVTSPAREVVLCHRDGCHFAPKRNPGPVLLPILGRKQDPSDPGIPIDISRANLFDTAYVHPLLRNSMVLWMYYDLYIKAILWLSAGSTKGMDQWVGEISPARHHPSKIFFNKSDRIAAYISEPYRPKTPGPRLWLYALRSALVQKPLTDTQGRHIDLAPFPEGFDDDGVVRFRDNGRPEYARMENRRVKPDVVVLCTGYKQTFPFLSSEKNEYLTPADANVRGIWNRDDPSVAFIGFLRPSLGAIPPLAEMQAQVWISHLLKNTRELDPRDEAHYRLYPPKGSRITYGVDHESYAYQLALDMGSAPGILHILKLMVSSSHPLRLLVVWALGANLNTKFRLRGPWRWEGARDVMVSEEFWATITRRPLLFGHFAVNLLPILMFGPLSALCWVYALLFGMGRRHVARRL